MSPDGSGLRQIATAEEGISTPTWSPARDMLAVASGNPRCWSLYDLRAGKLVATPQRLIPTAEAIYFLPMTWSPDGTSIAGVQMASGRSSGELGGFPVFIYSVRDRTYRPLDVAATAF